ncbi:hypothetical protein LSH36_365g05029 [Paralvinella palmiformis]|uniref:Major facilitator superfamily (MFS) profile domain-containing protein n=1 Tax=Paralvinella palmiformis TaxID=53620 RepID=A0AAD9N0X7_9ANNE|nr:hypothetical protein LSH36_365g05029 [Paralvinella palmiformis]
MFVIGGARSFGIIFVHLTEFFDASSVSAAWSIALLAFGMSFYGPLAGFVSKRYSFRLTAMIGGAAQGFSFVVSAFAPNIYFVSMMIGIVDGFAVGFLYTTAISAVSEYFYKRRSLALGIAVAGSSVGQLVLPQLMRMLLDHYGYFGCMLIYGALSWNSVLAGALYRPTSFYKRQKKGNLSTEHNTDELGIGGDQIDEKKMTTDHSCQSRASIDSVNELSNNKDKDNVNLGSLSILDFGKREDTLDNPDSVHHRRTICCDRKLRNKIKNILDLRFMRHPNFWFYTAAIFLANPALLNLVLFIPPYAGEIHIDKKRASLVLSAGGICDFIGKLASGAFEGLHLIRVRHLLSAVLLTIFVVSTICITYPCFISLLAMVMIFGVCGGIFVAMHPVYLLEIFPTETFTMAYAFAVGIHSISALILPIVGGAVADGTGPLAGFVSKRYSFRLTAMIGGAAQGFSFVVSAFAPNIYFVSMMIGIVDGFAVGFLYTTAISAVSEYFYKRRSLALGIAVAGSSVGQLVLPQLMRMLLDHYGYFGCMLIYGALSWNSVLAGALYRPTSFYKRQKKGNLSTEHNTDELGIGGDQIDEKKMTTDHSCQSRASIDPVNELSNNKDKDNVNLGSLSILDFGKREDTLDNPDSVHHRRTICCDRKLRNKIKNILDLRFMRHPNFWFYTAAIFLANPALLNLVLFIPPYAGEIHIDKKRASLVLSAGGICDFIGKLASDKLAYKILARRCKKLTEMSTLIYYYYYHSHKYCIVTLQDVHDIL